MSKSILPQGILCRFFHRDREERLLELAAFCGKLSAQQSIPQGLQAIEETFRRLAAVLEQQE